MEILKQAGRDLANRFMVVLALFYIAGIITGRIWLESPGVAFFPVAGVFFSLIAFLLFRRIGLYKLIILLVAALCGGLLFFTQSSSPLEA